MIEKFTFDLHPTAKVKTRLILVKAESESRAHVVMKMLAYLLYYDPRLQVEVDVGFHYKPDLSIKNSDGEIELWIDCGYVSVEKAVKLSSKLRRTRILLLKETRSKLRNYKRLVEKKTEAASRLEFVGFEGGFIAGIAEVLEKINDVTLFPVTETAIGVAVGEHVFESELYYWRGGEDEPAA